MVPYARAYWLTLTAPLAVGATFSGGGCIQGHSVRIVLGEGVPILHHLYDRAHLRA